MVFNPAHASHNAVHRPPDHQTNFPEGLETLRDPQDLQSSPLGWHNTGSGNSTTTSYVPLSLPSSPFFVHTMHDFAYRYGFTEKAFNFQQSNLGKGGKEGDRVLMSVQDASGVNNANFATPPE